MPACQAGPWGVFLPGFAETSALRVRGIIMLLSQPLPATQVRPYLEPVRVPNRPDVPCNLLSRDEP